jgi:predicted DNA binding CopG/RHH family protein
MKQRVPRMTTDCEAKAFLAKDLSDLDFSQFKPVRFEFEAKSGQLNMRLPQALLAAIKQRAAARGIAYTKFVRQVLEADLSSEKEAPLNRARKRASVGAETLPAHSQDVVLAGAEILAASPADAVNKVNAALLRVGTAIGRELAELSNKLQDMADQNEDITRENRELKGRVDGLTATVADQGNQNKQLQDKLRVVHESFRRDVAGRAQDDLPASSEHH